MARHTEPIPEIHAAIRSIMDERGITVAELGRLMEVSYAVAWRWANGPGPSDTGHGPTLAKLPHIEDALGVWRGEIIRRAGPGWFRAPMSTLDVIRNDLEISEEDREEVANLYLLKKERALSRSKPKSRSKRREVAS